MADQDSDEPGLTPPPETAATTSLHYSLLGPSLLKSGQDGVDQKKVGEIIYNASKGSRFFKHEEKRDEKLTEKIEELMRRKGELEKTNLSSELRSVDEKIAALEKGRDLTQIIVHVDCDAFYASVEELERPELKKVPMAVGRGVLTTCNYKAREFGVRSGMAGHIAKKLCPQLVFLPISIGKYSAKAKEVRAVLVKYDPRFHGASIDEAFLNLTKYLEDHPDMAPETLVEHIRHEVFETTKITISAGIAPNSRIAKICSNKNKPNGQFCVPNRREAVISFISSLPVRKLPGVGRVFERELAAIGIHTCADIYPVRAYIRPLFGDKALSFLLSCHLGLGRTEIRPAEEYERKSVGTERTFRDLSGSKNLEDRLKLTADELEKELKKTEFTGGRVLVLKVKLATYEVLTRQRQLSRPVGLAEELLTLSLPLLHALEKEFDGRLKIRLMGLRVTQLVTAKKEVVDIQKWFHGNGGGSGSGSAPSSPRKRKPMVDKDGWEVWPEEEFEMAEREEREEQMKLTQELSEELELMEKEREEEEGKGKEKAEHEPELGRSGNEPRPASLSPPPQPGEAVTSDTWECPLCHRLQPADDMLFNQHMDFCLSREAIRTAVQESSSATPRATSEGSPKRKKRFLSSKAS